MLAAIRIRGNIGIDVNINKTLDMLKLTNQNVCVFFKDTPSMRGMLTKVKDYVAWGESSDDMFKTVIEKKGQEYNGPTEDKSKKMNYSTKFVEVDNKKFKPFFRLSPPRGGFEKKGIKTPFTLGGALGFRGDKINDLIKKMI